MRIRMVYLGWQPFPLTKTDAPWWWLSLGCQPELPPKGRVVSGKLPVMVAPTLHPTLTLESWQPATQPDWRESLALPVQPGEACYAILYVKLSKRVRWKPTHVDDLPPIHLGKLETAFAQRTFEGALRDVRTLNGYALRRLARGKSLGSWCAVVRMVYPFDVTARIVSAKGGAA
jgi:hypothetical protein